MKPLHLFALGLTQRRAPGDYGALSYRLGLSISEGVALALPYVACFAAGVAFCRMF